MSSSLLPFLEGALALGYVISGMFFLRFWRTTGERLFGFFAAAFGLLAAQRALLLGSTPAAEHAAWYYGLRLLAFALLIFGIVENNRKAEGE